MASRKYKDVELADSKAEMDAPHVALEQQSSVRIGCPVCGFFGSRVVCSAGDLAAHHRYLERFYRRRWRVQNEATAEDRLTFAQNYSTDIVVCLGCGLVYRHPRSRTDAIVRAYRRERYDDTYLQVEYLSQRAWARRKFPSVAHRLLRTSRKEVPRVLEIGSFVGGFLAEGLAHGWDMFGVDPGDDATAFCRALGLPVFCGTVEEARLNPASFDAVIIWNTFDQLPDPHPTMTAATRLLRNGGMLVVRVPNGACFQWAMRTLPRLPARLRSPLQVTLAWNNLLTFPYRYGYALDTLTNLTESHGFRRTGCVPDTLVPASAEHLNLWAVVERHCCNWLCRAVRQAPGLAGQFPFAPWLDVYFERACADQEEVRPAARSPSGLGILPVYAPAALGQTRFNRGVIEEGRQ